MVFKLVIISFQSRQLQYPCHRIWVSSWYCLSRAIGSCTCTACASVCLVLQTPSELRDGSMSDCPPELEYFKHVDQLIIKQQLELFESKTSSHLSYAKCNSVDKIIYFAQFWRTSTPRTATGSSTRWASKCSSSRKVSSCKIAREVVRHICVRLHSAESSCCWRCWCGPDREFTMHITDNKQQSIVIRWNYQHFFLPRNAPCSPLPQEVMRLRRPFTCVESCCVGACAGCNMTMFVESPPGNVIGTIDMESVTSSQHRKLNASFIRLTFCFIAITVATWSLASVTCVWGVLGLWMDLAPASSVCVTTSTFRCVKN